MKKHLIFLTLIAVSACSLAQKQPADDKFHYLTEEISPDSIAAPSYKDEKILKQQIEKVIKIQNSASMAEISAAKYEHKLRTSLLAELISKDFTAKNYPQTYKTLDNALSDCKQVTAKAKTYWSTKRPYLVSKKVKALVDDPNTSGAYPSGHTTCSLVLAKVLSEIFPQREKVLLSKADSIAKDRVILGLHFPEDLEGGRALSKKIISALGNSLPYQQDINLSKKEILQFKPSEK